MNTAEESQKKLRHGAVEQHGRGLLDSGRKLSRRKRQRLLACYGFFGLLTAAFFKPLIALAIYAVSTDLHSHILLIPFISAYIIFLNRKRLPTEYGCSLGWAVVPFAAGLAVLSVALHLGRGADALSRNDFLALMTFAYLCFLAGSGFFFLGRKWMAAAAFPVVFLIFMVPLPDRIVAWLETASTMASTEAAHLFFRFSGTPVLRDGAVMQLPGIAIEVARECSGIRSSWVLLITSLLASYLFLKSPWRRAVLVAAAIPLGVIRNGFRILMIGLLCVHLGPEQIDSPLHRRGGPAFFVLSLVALFLLTWVLRRKEVRRSE